MRALIAGAALVLVFGAVACAPKAVTTPTPVVSADAVAKVDAVWKDIQAAWAVAQAAAALSPDVTAAVTKVLADVGLAVAAFDKAAGSTTAATALQSALISAAGDLVGVYGVPWQLNAAMTVATAAINAYIGAVPGA